MPRRKICYSEGDLFSVPLRKGGFALGVVVRMDGKGIVVGYFFGPYKKNIELLKDIEVKPNNNVFICMFGDLGFLNKEWKIIGSVSEWSRDEWLMPLFLRQSISRIANDDNECWLTVYDEDSLKSVKETTYLESELDIQNYPKDGLSGYGFVELRLTKILQEGN